jgi:hypothetical protein
VIVVLLACLAVALGAIVGFAVALAHANTRLAKARTELALERDRAEGLRRRLVMRVYDREEAAP